MRWDVVSKPLALGGLGIGYLRLRKEALDGCGIFSRS